MMNFRCIGFFLIPLVLGLLSMAYHPKEARWSPPPLAPGEITYRDAAALESSIWVDARKDEVFEKGSYPEAINLNHDNFENQLPELLGFWQPGDVVVVFCDSLSCDESHLIADRLRGEVGLEDVLVLYGGWSSMKKGLGR